MAEECAFKVNVLIVGDSGVGKSTLLLRIAKGEFVAEQPPVLDRENRIVDRGSYKTHVVLHDTAGQERFGQLTASVFRHAEGIILAYDCTREETFENLKRNWMQGCEMYTQRCSIVIASTKNDLEHKEVDSEAAREYAQGKGFEFFETSSKTGECVEEALQSLVASIEREQPELRRDGVSKKDGNVSLEKADTDGGKRKSKSFCYV